jgi:hypothetical protein
MFPVFPESLRVHSLLLFRANLHINIRGARFPCVIEIRTSPVTEIKDFERVPENLDGFAKAKPAVQ